ncbi:MAG: four helix bundle protein [Saprospiraceae bacterium]|jgi:four helix bundle protein|nr:four helix bundle protein [Saprospiraceae bacterium]
MDEEKLKKRFKEFGIAVIMFLKELPDLFEIRAIKNQLVRSCTSPGANYRAACRGKSGPDFINKLKMVEEELDETQYWLEMIVAFIPEKRSTVAVLWKEADELLSITVASIKTSRKSVQKK